MANPDTKPVSQALGLRLQHESQLFLLTQPALSCASGTGFLKVPVISPLGSFLIV